MKVIGITGGVGAGKTKLLSYIAEHYNCRILLADEAANALKEPGMACYDQIVRLLGREILNEDMTINRAKMAERIFADAQLLTQVNEILHPAVKAYILEQIKLEREKGLIEFFFLEAALLIECGYQKIVDELWYISAAEEVRRARLKSARGYTDEKIDQIISAQLSEEAYKSQCDFIIDNSREEQWAYEQIDRKMGEYLWKN